MRALVGPLPPGRVMASAGAVGVVTWLAALLVLTPALALALGDAGERWENASAQVGVAVMLAGAGALACGLGAAAGVWRAAAVGAQSRREALVAGVSVPLVLALVATLAVAEPGLDGLGLALLSCAVTALGAVAAGLSVARRLDG